MIWNILEIIQLVVKAFHFTIKLPIKNSRLKQLSPQWWMAHPGTTKLLIMRPMFAISNCLSTVHHFTKNVKPLKVILGLQWSWPKWNENACKIPSKWPSEKIFLGKIFLWKKLNYFAYLFLLVAGIRDYMASVVGSSLKRIAWQALLLAVESVKRNEKKLKLRSPNGPSKE